MTTKINGAVYPGVWVEKQVAFAKIIFSKDISALLSADLYVLGTTTAAGANTAADSTFDIVESALVQAVKNLETKATVLGVSNYKQNTATVVVTTGSASSSGTTVTITNTSFAVGQTVAVTAGTGSFLPGTKIVSLISSTGFVVDRAPTTDLSGATVTGSTYAGGQVDVMLGYAEGWFSDVSGVISTGIAIPNAQARVFAPGSAPTATAGDLVSVNPTAVTFGLDFSAFDGSMPIGTYSNGALHLVANGATAGSAATPMGSSGYYPTLLITA